MIVAQLVLSPTERKKLVEIIRQEVLKGIHGEYRDPILWTDLNNAAGDAVRQVDAIERQKIKLQQQQAAVVKAVAAAEKPKARRDAKLADAKAKIAKLQRELQEAEAAAVAIAKEDAEIIDERPSRLKGAADGTANILNSMEMSLWRLSLHAEWSAPAELFEEEAKRV